MNIGSAVVDFIKSEDNSVIVEEVKRSSSMERAYKLQLLHYLSILEPDSGDTEMIGIVRYPDESKTQKYRLSNHIDEYTEAKEDIKDIVTGKIPKPTWKTACRNCSMRVFCHS